MCRGNQRLRTVAISPLITHRDDLEKGQSERSTLNLGGGGSVEGLHNEGESPDSMGLAVQ